MSKKKVIRKKPEPNRRVEAPKANKKNWGARLSSYFSSLSDREMRPRVVVGLVLTLLSLFLAYTFLDYVLHGARYQSLLLSHQLEEAERLTAEVRGKSGVSGIRMMHYMVNEWVGLAVVFVIYMIGAIGLGMLYFVRVRYAQTIIFSCVATFWSALALTWLCRPIAEYFFYYPGGVVGEMLYNGLVTSIGKVGVVLLLLLLLLISLFLFFSSIRRRYIRWVEQRKHREVPMTPTGDVPSEDEEEVTETVVVPEEPSLEDEREVVSMVATPTNTNSVVTKDQMEEVGGAGEASSDDGVALEVVDRRYTDEEGLTPQDRARVLVEELGLYDPRRDLSSYEMPPLELLKLYEQGNGEIDQEEIQENKEMIVNTLRSFKIEIISITATVGPAITLYEVVPAAGVHISKIRNLEDNISMSLSANGIRIIAPIPGKGTIGLEVPNKKPQIVSMRSVIGSKAFQESKAALPVALGRTITNEVFVFDLAKAPHLLVAGATGQGKSVGLNAIICSLLYQKHPSELKFVMIDPKMVEFSMYALIEKHYMAKLPEEPQVIITETSRAANTLNSLCQEMDDRYELLSSAHVRNLKEYNEKFVNRQLNPEKGHRFMPYIVLIIDEYGDLIMTAGKDIEMPITRLAQKARAVGIHAIIATQRPTASIITGAIKANFPGRLAFRVISAVDSRIILDAGGANRLVGKGDSLYSQGNDLTRVQCAFIDTPEVNDLVKYIGEQRGYPAAYELPEVQSPEAEGSTEGGAALDPNNRDALFNEVAERLVMEQKASTSFIQQIFAIGYNRAARITVQLEAAGIIGPQDGSKPREVLVQSQEQLQRILYPDE